MNPQASPIEPKNITPQQQVHQLDLSAPTLETRATHSYDQAYDEMFINWGDFKHVRPHYQAFSEWLRLKKPSFLEEKQAQADLMFRKVGVTFSVYNDDEPIDDSTTESSAQSAAQKIERTIPFDVLPRIISQTDWQILEQGLKQRVQALNLFLKDVYHEQNILMAHPFLRKLILGNKQYRADMQGVRVPKDIYSHISGIDIVRDDAGNFLVLEDNLRVPSGVSYMLENRRMMMRLFPELFMSQNPILPVAHYPDMLRQTLLSAAPEYCADEPTMVLLTPGMHNSAYFEHAFLAQQLGIELVEGKDLLVKDMFVYIRTTQGLKRVDVIYRRIDDDYLDPFSLNPHSSIGVAGLVSAYRMGHVNIINAVGTGVADDKSVYPFVPDMIRFYLDETPILNNVPTYICADEKQLSHVLANLNQLVVKEVHGAGGYGMLIGTLATQAELAEFKQKILAHPENYIAQPVICLSSNPTFVDAGIAPRHIDLRPFVLTSDTIQIVPGGLTRVALEKNSLVVNSSQGGGTKDTWVLAYPT